MNFIKKYSFFFLLFLFTSWIANAQVYPLSDDVFIAYLKGIHPDLVNENDELVISQVGSANITSINLSNSGVKNVDGIQYLTNLSSIDLSNNTISELPSLNPLMQLKTIDFSFNQLTSFDVINNLKNIETLDLSNNSIATFPSLHVDVALKSLDISHNQLTEINNFGKANNLETLTISYNWISSLQEFTALNFPVLNQVDVAYNRLYFDDYPTLPASAINRETQRTITLTVPDTLYIGDTLRIDMSFDTHEDNFHVLIEKPTYFELADSYTTELLWPITDTSQSGTYYVDIINTTYTSNRFNSLDFSFLVLEERPEPPVEPEKPTIPNPKPSYTTNYPTELLPSGNPEERTIFFEGPGEAIIYNKAGVVYNKFTLPHKWDGSNSSGVIIPGYYLIRINDNEVVKITVID